MKLSIKGIAILMAVTLFSCGRGSNSNPVNSADIQPGDKLEDQAANKKEKQPDFSTTDSAVVQINSSNIALQSGNPSLNIDWDKKIIKTASVTLELIDFKTFNSTIHNSIKRYGAYISNEQQNQRDDKIENVITIKVPAAQFEDLMNALPAEGVKVLEKSISTEDVTGEIVDTKARIEARKQVRDQYLGLLKKAKTMKEILEVQKEVSSIQEDIEAGSGRAELLGHEAAYSTVNLTYFQYLTATSGNDNSSPTFITKLKDAFDDGAAIVTGLLLILVTFWPIILTTVVVWIVYKKYSARHVKLVKKEQ
ncbi:MAG: hypothetical protein JWQ09_4765 [Segetibacter sp.]|nr:hypothetical protein [Segetibacter sp.]